MSELSREACFERLMPIYVRSVAPGWDKLVSLLSVGEQGGVWLSNTSYVYVAGQVPYTFGTTEFDEADEMLEKGADSLFLELWELDAQAGHKWYHASYTLYPDGCFVFVPSSAPESTFAEVLATPPAP